MVSFDRRVTSWSRQSSIDGGQYPNTRLLRRDPVLTLNIRQHYRLFRVVQQTE